MSSQNRRDFIKSASHAFGSALRFPSCLKQRSSFRFFTPDGIKHLQEWCSGKYGKTIESIVPDDQIKVKKMLLYNRMARWRPF